MTAAPALTARIERVRIDGRDILQGLQLSLPAGRWTAIVGPNGAGKSTLLRAVSGLQPCHGEVRLAG
ncbi:ATP-binding cassette domain-containing protein, partial [Mammaliicoccus lentus]|uniref:ATP-binding cassette domain-containing protein n=1 Tax=Mammaliicoccus lentus TaxID=42858 RepID=UPI003CF30DD0